ncbi:type 1 fimbrial protein [Aeromonas veronii]|uniref:type 1 fimbrial protein n=1 Tax=Aeromonas veronii TaxID=654 RepID=UPI001F15BD67|nr:type 1 fimbrial protein [Aeromonas veronii]MCF5765455.1 type 1 fimbrial protein [Aeromonas veronii]
MNKRVPASKQDNPEVCMKSILVAFALVILGIPMAQATQTGHITFHGSILEDACRVDQQEKLMQVTCLSGSAQTTETVDLQKLAREASVNLSSSQISYQWVDAHHTMAIITISHR